MGCSVSTQQSTGGENMGTGLVRVKYQHWGWVGAFRTKTMERWWGKSQDLLSGFPASAAGAPGWGCSPGLWCNGIPECWGTSQFECCNVGLSVLVVIFCSLVIFKLNTLQKPRAERLRRRIPAEKLDILYLGIDTPDICLQNLLGRKFFLLFV